MRSMVEGVRLFAAPALGPLYQPPAAAGPPPRSGEDL
jgi:hypothetical protein